MSLELQSPSGDILKLFVKWASYPLLGNVGMWWSSMCCSRSVVAIRGKKSHAMTGYNQNLYTNFRLLSSLRWCLVWLLCTVSVKHTSYQRTFCLKILCNKNGQVHIVNCNNLIKLTKMMETKELHNSIEPKIRLELKTASLKELVLGLL